MHVAEHRLPAAAEPAAAVRFKELHELEYWAGRKRTEGVLANAHYEHFYTRHFGLERSFYDGKVILDIGCGPRGSLEWAHNAARRFGVDPLANDYLMLGAIDHGMRYLCAPSECILVPDAYCDAVFSFNSLDHVEDVDQTLAEVRRITRRGGLFLLLVEVNHEPTPCEPHSLKPDGLATAMHADWTCADLRVYAPGHGQGLYDSVRAGVELPHGATTRQAGYLSAKFVRR